MKRIRPVVMLLVLAWYSAVGSDPPNSTDANVAKVALSRTGVITLNGREVNINEVREVFAKLAETKGVVWYYREAADVEEPHPTAMLVIRAIVDSQLPVSISTKPDFSDVVLPDGSTRPR